MHFRDCSTQTTALHGMGGIGKSVVAAALARTAEARRVFTDGIVWLRIGKQPDLLTAVRVLVASFHEDISTYTDGAVALTQLSEGPDDGAAVPGPGTVAQRRPRTVAQRTEEEAAVADPRGPVP
jgi:hypothetical protein